jgi:hypothetical protein
MHVLGSIGALARFRGLPRRRAVQRPGAARVRVKRLNPARQSQVTRARRPARCRRRLRQQRAAHVCFISGCHGGSSPVGGAAPHAQWDLRGFRRAQAAGEDTSQIQIPHLDVDLAISPKLRSDRLRERFEAALEVQKLTRWDTSDLKTVSTPHLLMTLQKKKSLCDITCVCYRVGGRPEPGPRACWG